MTTPAHLADLHIIGIMTGNSLDGVDCVLTRFTPTGEMTDLAAHSKTLDKEMIRQLKMLRNAVENTHGDMPKAVNLLENKEKSFNDIHDAYLTYVAQTVRELIAQNKNAAAKIDALAFHGQTCAHNPPNANRDNLDTTYTVQVGNGQQLANDLGIPVVYDFRSDDLMNGGQGAPLAPLHHLHLAEQLQKSAENIFAFANAGNTSNFTLLGKSTLGWDAGPCNHFPDYLMRTETDELFDKDGTLAQTGAINTDLLAELFDHAACTPGGGNFLLQGLPKSSDPQWYKNTDLLNQGSPIPFADRLRTACYFAAYVAAFSWSMLPADIAKPTRLLLSGGGWKNPIIRESFSSLMAGLTNALPILPQHKDAFEKLTNPALVIEPSEKFGIDGTAMEARLFADLAACRIMGVPFTTPSTTGTNTPTVCGVIAWPDDYAKDGLLHQWLTHFNSADLTTLPQGHDPRWNRAVKGWQKKLKKAA